MFDSSIEFCAVLFSWNSSAWKLWHVWLVGILMEIVVWVCNSYVESMTRVTKETFRKKKRCTPCPSVKLYLLSQENAFTLFIINAVNARAIWIETRFISYGLSDFAGTAQCILSVEIHSNKSTEMPFTVVAESPLGRFVPENKKNYYSSTENDSNCCYQ